MAQKVIHPRDNEKAKTERIIIEPKHKAILKTEKQSDEDDKIVGNSRLHSFIS